MATNACIITGGSSGIGKATITLFQQQQWDCFNLSRTPCNVAGVNNITCDLTAENWEAQLTLPQQLRSYEQIVLVHNAACCLNDKISELPTKQLRNVLELNVIAPNRLNQCLLPVMKKGSAIIYIGSTLAEKAVPGAASYITSKHAIAGMMKATCQDLAGTGIHTACVCPGITDTEMLRQRVNHDETVLTQLAKIQTMDRLIEPHEIAELILFCAKHPVVNGAMIHGHLGQRAC